MGRIVHCRRGEADSPRPSLRATPTPLPSTFLILGATGGIGSAVARHLSAQDVSIVLAGRRDDALQSLSSSVGGAETLSLDGSYASIVEAIDTAAERHGELKGIVNCAGSLLLKPAHRTSEDEYRATLAANLDTAFATVSAGARAMMKSGGSIVLVTSAVARTGLPNHEAIAAAKAGVAGLTLSAAASYGPRGIRVNAVSPGLVRTPLTESLLAAPANEKSSIAMHALGRLGEPEDVARAIAWLLDPEQSWVTGQVLGVDGGLASVRGR